MSFKIIPEDAGSTWGTWFLASCNGDHPRGCGEHIASAFWANVGVGSSPQMRGAQVLLSVIFLRSEDHPRGCGEHSNHTSPHTVCRGSSPRMRGAPVADDEAQGLVGIIPADAGSTRRQALRFFGREDHPRGCGEHVDQQVGEFEHLGSSPRMRGAHCPVLRIRASRRIIPADAGSTCSDDGGHVNAQDHPRGCGEHILPFR